MRTFGKYRLVEPLASGGMADVWRAEVPLAEGVVKEVALKLVRGEHAEKSAFERMFVQEARLATRLSHANVVQVFEFDQIGGRYYIAMELVRGRHLGQVADRARERGVRFGVARAVHVAAEVARALGYAHRLADAGRPLGLVHRDVSPHNVLVSFEGEVKLADFGIARAMNLGELTDPGMVKGKLAYMAPEQARGDAVDARADVFSLGVVLWELCAGRRLFSRDSDAATLGAVLAPEPVSPPSAWNEDVPPELDAAVLGALERDPERRTRSAQELASALATILLRVTRTPEDVDLRAFVQRLFADEAARAASGAPALEATVVRPAPAPVAREPVADRPVAPPAVDAPAVAPDEAASGVPPEGRVPGAGLRGEESATRTAAAPRHAGPRRFGRVAAAVVALGAVGAAASALVRSRSPDAPAMPAPSETAGGVAEPEPAPPGASTPTSLPTSASSSTPTLSPTPEATPTSASTSPPTSDAIPNAVSPPSRAAADGGEDAATVPATRAGTVRPLEWVHAVGQLAMPSADTGEGILFVNATPWGTVIVDGFELGETPQEVRLPAGRHRVRVARPNQRGVESEVTVEAGRRTKFLR